MIFLQANQILTKTISLWKPPPRLTISEWADAYRRLSPESSAEVGQWRTSRVPYLKEILDEISHSEKVVFMASSQVAKTEAILNTVGFFMSIDPSPIMNVQPTIEMAETISKDRVAPMLRDTPVLKGLVGQKRAKDSENTILHKSYPGGHLTLSGANSSASLASRPIRVLLIDECDRFPFSAGREGDPIKLAVKRTATFWNRRIVIVSTPTIKGASRIEYEYELSDKRKYFVPCPHCGHYQILSWGQVKWESIKLGENEEVQTAWHECVECSQHMTDSHKTEFLRLGEWRATAKGKTPGFHIWQAYSPWSTFKQIVQEFLDCKGNRELLKVWINTVLGESFDELGGEGLSWQSLLARCEPYNPLTVPMGGLILTAGVDVQKDRLALSVWAWGKGEEAWLVYTTELYGDPLQSSVWEQLDLILESSFTHQSGNELSITATCVDTGYQNQVVYNYARTRSRVYATKGLSTPNKPVMGKPSSQEVNHQGRVLKKGIKLWPVGTDTAKSILFQRLRITHQGPGCCHFPIGIDQEFFEQSVAEKVVTKFTRGFAKREWVKTRARNEALDCLVLAYAAAHLAGISRLNWEKLSEKVNPKCDNSPSKISDSPEQDNSPSKVSEKSNSPSKKRTSWVNRSQTRW